MLFVKIFLDSSLLLPYTPGLKQVIYEESGLLMLINNTIALKGQAPVPFVHDHGAITISGHLD